MGRFRLFSWLLLFLSLGPGAGLAQVQFEGANRALAGPDFDIPMTAGSVQGTNLIHRFVRFSVLDGQTATFEANGGIANVISLVSGGERSLLGGRIELSPGASANFFLLNPAGIQLEPTASFGVPGRLTLAAASGMMLDDGSTLSVTPDGSSLSFASPGSFGFLPSDGALVLDGASLTYGVGQNADAAALTLVGGDVELRGARIDNTGSVPDLMPGGTETVQIIADRNVQVGNKDTEISRICLSCGGAQGGGTLLIEGQNITLDGNTIIDVDMFIDTAGGVQATGPDSSGMRVSLRAADTIIVDDHVRLFARTGRDTVRDGPQVLLRARRIIVRGARAFDADGRTIAESSALRVGAAGSGAGGELKLLAYDEIRISEEARLFGLSTTGASAQGMGGTIILTAPSIVIENDARLEVETRGPGPAGILRIEDGDGIVVQDLLILDDARVQSNAGIDISVLDPSDNRYQNQLRGAERVNDSATGDGGAVMIDITGDILITGSLTAKSFATADADAGAVTVSAQSLTLRDGGTIGSGARDARGGNIAVNTRGDVILRNGGMIQTDVNAGPGAGTVTVNGRLMVLLAGSEVTTTAAGPGFGGDITFNALSFVSQNALLDADSQLGLSGTILLQDGEELVTDFGTVAPDLADPWSLTQDPCRAAAAGLSSLNFPGVGSARAAQSDAPGFFLGAVPFPEDGGDAHAALDPTCPKG